MFPAVIKGIDQAFKVLKSFGAGKWEVDYALALRLTLLKR